MSNTSKILQNVWSRTHFNLIWFQMVLIRPMNVSFFVNDDLWFCVVARKQEIIKVTEQLIESINNGDFEAYA